MKRLIVPLMALAACQPAPEAPTPEPPPPTTSPAPSTSSTAPATTSTSTTTSTTTTVTTVMQVEPEPVVSPQRAADGPGLASVSWYGDESGSTTANGEHYDPDGFTFAHRSMPFGTLVEFCRGGRCVVARCTDRGPFIAGRTFDLSRAAFAALAPLGSGVVSVTWRRA